MNTRSSDPIQCLQDLMPQMVEVEPMFDQEQGRQACSFPEQGEKDVFRADVVVPEGEGLPE